MKHLFILLSNIPAIQMAGMLLNNTLYYFDIDYFTYITDFTIGNSIITTFLLYVCSYVFNFCIWHKLIITANFINICIAIIDTIVLFPISDVQLLIIYYTISVIFISISTIIHINKKK